MQKLRSSRRSLPAPALKYNSRYAVSLCLSRFVPLGSNFCQRIFNSVVSFLCLIDRQKTNGGELIQQCDESSLKLKEIEMNEMSWFFSQAEGGVV